MAFNVGGLTAWTNANSQVLIAQSVLQGETIDLISLITGVKYKSELKYLDAPVTLQAGGCGFNASGSVVFTKKDVSVVDVKINETMCPEDLNEYSLNLSLRPGFNKDIPFEQQIMAQKTKEINKTIETNIWANAAASTTVPEGLIHKFLADVTITGNTTLVQNLTGATTASEWMAFVYAMQNKLPEAIQGATDLTLFVGHPIFRKMVQSLVIANLYHIDQSANDGMTAFYFPGTNIKVVPVNGLNTLNNMVLTPASNLVYVTDLTNEQDKIEVFWAQEAQLVYFISRFKYGIDYYFSEYVVLSKI